MLVRIPNVAFGIFKNQQEEVTTVELPKAPYLFFMKGLLTNLSNPKAVIYFGSVFSLFLANPQLDQVHWLLLLLCRLKQFYGSAL